MPRQRAVVRSGAPGSIFVMKRDSIRVIEENLAQSRALGERQDRAAEQVVTGLRRAARAGRYRAAVNGRYVTDAHAKTH